MFFIGKYEFLSVSLPMTLYFLKRFWFVTCLDLIFNSVVFCSFLGVSPPTTSVSKFYLREKESLVGLEISVLGFDLPSTNLRKFL